MDYRKIETIKLPVFEEHIEINMDLPQENCVSPEEILEKAKIEQEKIIQQAKIDGEKIKKQFEEQGFAQGYQQGLSSAQKETAMIQESFSNRFKETEARFQEVQEQLLKEASKDVQEIVLYITETLIGGLLQEKEDIIVDLYKILAPMVTDKKITEVKVNHKDYEFMHDYLSFTSKTNAFKLTTCEEIAPGTIFIDTEQGYLMKDINREFNEIVTELRNVNG